MTAPTLASAFSEKEGDGRGYSDPFSARPGPGGRVVYDRYPSVTTALKQTSKDGLARWKVQMALKEVIKNPDAFYQRSDHDFMRGFENAADRFRDERAIIGDEVHTFIEHDLKGLDLPEFWDREVLQCIQQWHEFYWSHDVQPWTIRITVDGVERDWIAGVETTVINRTVGYMGTADLIGSIDGVMQVSDAKTSRKTHDEHHMQVAGLVNAEAALVEVPRGTEGAVEFRGERTVKGVKHEIRAWFLEVPLPNIEAASLIHLRPDEGDPLSGKFVPAFQELVESPWDEVPFQFRRFSAFVAAHTAEQDLKKFRRG